MANIAGLTGNPTQVVVTAAPTLMWPGVGAGSTVPSGPKLAVYVS